MTLQRKAAARAVADTSDGVVLARVEIAAPPARVFAALTTDELTKWWGSAEMYRTTKFTIDLRPGGAWRSDGVGADGSAFHVEGEVLEVDPPRRLVQTWKPSWEPGPADERAAMQAHGEYWRRKLADGVAIAFGPVADPSGGWGLGILAVPDEATLRAFQAADPAIQANIGLRYETLPMLRVVH